MIDRTAPTMSTEQVAHILRLLRSADTAELKLSVPDANQRSAVEALHLDPLDAQLRQVVFFDTADLALDRSGVVVRADFPRRIVAELWNYPDGSRILELSTKCATTEAFEAAAETRAYLAERGVDLGGEQLTKTRRALEFFAGELKVTGNGSKR